MRAGLATSLATLAIAAAGLVHAGALDAPFYVEDLDAVVHNPYVKRLTEPTVAMRAPPGTMLEGRPLASLTLAANHALGGLVPRAFRIFALFVHVTTAILWFEFLRRLFTRTGVPHALAASAVAALLWVVHPLHSTTILFAAARPESLAALFFVATLLCAERALEENAPRDWSILCVLCCALGMACSEALLATPFAVLFLAHTLGSRSLSATLAERRGFYVALIATSSIGFASWLHAGIAPRWPDPAAPYAFTMILFPFILSLVPPNFPSLPVSLLLGVPTMIWLLVGSLRFGRERRPEGFLCGSLFAVFLLMGLHPEADGSMERQLLLPCALVLGTICARVSRLGVGAPILTTILVCGAVTFGVLSVRRGVLHQDPLEAWRRASNANVASTRAANEVARLAQEAGEEELASSMRVRSLTFDRDQPGVHFDRALELERTGLPERADFHFQRAVELAPDLAKTQLLLGYRDALRGDLELALPRMKRALNLQPDLVHDEGVREAVLLVSWNLAVAEEPEISDPTQVVVWLTPLQQAEGGPSARVLDTLAVARAAQKDYQEALRLSRDALSICEREGRIELERDIERRTFVYSQAQPFRVRVLDQ